MHLNLEELLALRDGEGAEEGARHVRSCPACAERLRGLQEMKGLLNALPDLAPARDLWPALREAARARTTRRWATLLGAAAASVLLLASVAIFWVSGARAPSEAKLPLASAPTRDQAGAAVQPPGAIAQGPVAAPGPGGKAGGEAASAGPGARGADQAELAKLIRRSQRLEGLLRGVEADPGVQSGWQAAAVTDLQDHIASLDGQIVVMGREGNPQDMVGLWQKRVDLLSTLLEVQTEPQGQVRL